MTKAIARTHLQRVTHLGNTHITHFDVESIGTTLQTNAHSPENVMANTTAFGFSGCYGSLLRLAAYLGFEVTDKREDSGRYRHSLTHASLVNKWGRSIGGELYGDVKGLGRMLVDAQAFERQSL